MTFLRTLTKSRVGPLKSGWIVAVLAVVLLFALAGCEQTGDMGTQPRYDPLAPSDILPNGQSAQVPPAGSVAYTTSGSPNDPSLTGMDTNGQPVKGFPVKVDTALVQLGQDRYNIYCIPCHGATAEGNGTATQFGFPKPPSLVSGNAKSLTNGDIFQVIQNGKGKMFSYGYRVKPNERWAVISYIRALQMSNGQPVDPQKLTPDQINQIGSQQ